jgi:hypothetical protein
LPTCRVSATLKCPRPRALNGGPVACR